MSQPIDVQLRAMLDIMKSDYRTHESVPGVIALFFLKYLNDTQVDVESDPDSLPSRFSLPASARWQMLVDDLSGQALSTAIDAIESMQGNEQLHGILPP